MLLRDMIRKHPISWFFFVLGSDLLSAYGLALIKQDNFSSVTSQQVLQFVLGDVIGIAVLCLLLDSWTLKHNPHFIESPLDVFLRVVGNFFAKYFGWMTILFVIVRIYLYSQHIMFTPNYLLSLLITSGFITIFDLCFKLSRFVLNSKH